MANFVGTKKRTAINVRGVEDIQIMEVKSLGGGDPANPTSLGYVTSVELKQDDTMVEITSGIGEYLNTISTAQKVLVTAVVKQTDKDMIDLLTLPANVNKFYAVYIKAKLVSGSFQEIYIPLCKIKSSATISFNQSERTTSVEIQALLGKHTTAVNIETISAGANDISFPVGSYFHIVEGTTIEDTYTNGTGGDLYTAFV